MDFPVLDLVGTAGSSFHVRDAADFAGWKPSTKEPDPIARSFDGVFFFFFGYHINLPGGRYFFFFRDFSHISGGAGTFPCRCVLYMRSASVFRMLLA